MQFSHFSLAIAALAGTCAKAQSPPGYEPSTSNQLGVTYANGIVVTTSINVPQASAVAAPILSLASATSLKSYTVVLLDLETSIGNPSIAAGTTVIHWILPSLTTLSTNTSTLSSTAADLVPYLGASPPAGYSHLYAFYLYEQVNSTLTLPDSWATYFANITASVYNRLGFEIDDFASAVGLGPLAAANYFYVTGVASNGTTTATATPSSNVTTATATPTASPTVIFTGGAASWVEELGMKMAGVFFAGVLAAALM